MALTDEVRFGTGVAGIQDISDAILRHQILKGLAKTGLGLCMVDYAASLILKIGD